MPDLYDNNKAIEYQFLKEYIMNRASTTDALDGELVANEAIKAWKVIEKEIEKEKC